MNYRFLTNILHNGTEYKIGTIIAEKKLQDLKFNIENLIKNKNLIKEDNYKKLAKLQGERCLNCNALEKNAKSMRNEIVLGQNKIKELQDKIVELQEYIKKLENIEQLETFSGEEINDKDFVDKFNKSKTPVEEEKLENIEQLETFSGEEINDKDFVDKFNKSKTPVEEEKLENIEQLETFSGEEINDKDFVELF